MCSLLACVLTTPGGGQEKQPKYPVMPKYEVALEKSVMVPMRDGVKLSTDLYMPKGAGDKLPVILIRTPYNKATSDGYRFRDRSSVAYMFAGQGFVVAIQDVRGKYESGGTFMGFVSGYEPSDGSDTVDWLASQPWSNGKVGTYGCSFLGELQMETAKMRNSHLVAMIPQSAGGSYRHPGLFIEGALELAAGFGWFREHGSLLRFQPAPDTPRSVFVQGDEYFNREPVLPRIDSREILKSLPVIAMMGKSQAPPTNFEEFVSHQSIADPWWNKFGFIRDTDRFNVPALHVNSWYDFGGAETLELFNLLQNNGDSPLARDNQFVIMSPTSHCMSENTSQHTIVGQRDLGDTTFDYFNLYLRWFDHWLKGLDNGVTKMPKVQIYVMGRNQWRSENEWPLARTNFTNYYLHSAGRANSRFGDGNLSTTAPESEPSDAYVYDPATPVATLGGPSCCTEGNDSPPGAFDQSGLETREDVLVYTTPPLKEGIEVTGPLRVVLYVSSSAKDTDFTAKLVDVYPDGTAYNVQEEILRARYREGYDQEVWMQPSGVYQVNINLDATSDYFGQEHRIRLEISSSNFPRFDRNLNTGGNNYDETSWVVAKNAIHHTKEYPSHIILPVIPQ